MSEEKEKNNNNKEKRCEIQRISPRLNCNFTKTFVKNYFNGSLGYVMTDYVLEHLLTCKKCYNEYRKYGTSIGVSFNVRDAAIKFVTEQAKDKRTCYSRDALLKLGFGKDLELMYNKWSTAADKLDIEVLMNLKSFSDFASDQITVREDHWEEDTNAVYNYTKWFAKELCKIIDSLERCLTLDIDNDDNLQLEGKNKDNEKS